jgi:glutamate-1-semialdehyde 2,1-aminomutase
MGRLSGTRVVTTRQEDPGDPLVRGLQAEGAEVRSWPALAFREPLDRGPLTEALGALDQFDWLAFTSPRAARVATERVRWREGHGRVGAVGASTARVLREGGWPVHAVGDGGGARGLVDTLSRHGPLDGTRVLFFAGSLASPTLREGLEAHGAQVTQVEAYRTEVVPPDGDTVRADLSRGVTAVLFASPSAVQAVSEAVGGGLGSALGPAQVIAIGPTTADALEREGIRATVAADPSMEGLISACIDIVRREQRDTMESEQVEGPDRSPELLKRARRVMPGGVNSPVRAFKGVGGTPRFIRAADGAFLEDVDGRRLLDFVGSWGVMVLGHNHPSVRRALTEALAMGTSYGAPTEGEILLAETITRLVPGVEVVRMVNSGTEATMSAIRLARAATGRDRVVKFRGGYHGHGDTFLVEAGSGAATLGVPSSPGVPRGTAANSLVAEFNDLSSVTALFDVHPEEIACVIVEPVCGNMGCVPPVEGFLSGLRTLCSERGALLIFDEVMTGFRVARGGAQERYGVTPDLTTLGKVIGGGLPVGAYGGREDLMRRIAPDGPVYQAGTLSGNPLAVAAGLATLRYLENEETVHAHLDTLGVIFDEGFAEMADRLGIPMRWQRAGGMGSLFFSEDAVTDWRSVTASSRVRFNALFHGLLEKGVHLPPSPFEAWFWSFAHTADDIERTLEVAEAVMTSERFPNA